MRYKRIHNLLVSATGRVRNRKTKKIVKQHTDDHGYQAVSANINGKPSRTRVHCLVAAAWIGPRPSGHHVRHLDCNKRNNRVENLAYGTPKENAQDSKKHNRYSKNGGKKRPIRRSDGVVYESCAAAAREFENPVSAIININRCARNKQKTYKGFTWETVQ